MCWEDETGIATVHDLFTKLLSFDKGDELLAWRGQADSRWLLQTSLDRILDVEDDYVSRLAEERALIEKFRIRAGEFLGRIEKQYVSGNHTNSGVSALAVLQHCYAPTRLLDWTHSPWVALYFAAIDHRDKPGAVWWFNQKSFEQKVGRRWKEYDMEQHRRPRPDGQINLDATAFSPNGPPWITKLHYPIPFRRIEVQQGFFTVAGRLGLEHGRLIADLLGEGEHSRFVIPASWKLDILNGLRVMNIHSRSLDYPGADLVGIDLRNKTNA